MHMECIQHMTMMSGFLYKNGHVQLRTYNSELFWQKEEAPPPQSGENYQKTRKNYRSKIIPGPEFGWSYGRESMHIKYQNKIEVRIINMQKSTAPHQKQRNKIKKKTKLPPPKFKKKQSSLKSDI